MQKDSFSQRKFVVGYWLLVTYGLLLTIYCSFAQNRYTYTRGAMGSEFNLVFYAPSDSVAKAASDSVFQRIEYLNRVLSDYLDGSEVNRLSATAGTGEWFYASATLFDVLQKSQRFSRQTDGAFDVTVGPVVQLWRRAVRRNEFPEKAQIKL
nr:FAD:protein FMN transferase [Spirosomataceae bacterium]